MYLICVQEGGFFMPENKMIIIQSKYYQMCLKSYTCQEIIKKGEATTIQQACEMASLSRSTFINTRIVF